MVTLRTHTHTHTHTTPVFKVCHAAGYVQMLWFCFAKLLGADASVPFYIVLE